MCVSIDLWIDWQTGGAHEQLLHGWGLKKHRICRRMEKVVGSRNSGRQKEGHAAARMSLGQKPKS